MTSKKIIYDFGSNNGDDIPYYLLKSDLVIAIEANPFLANLIKDRFKKEIKRGNLIVENYVCTVEDRPKMSPFFIHKTFSPLSQLPTPSETQLEQFDKVMLPSINVIDLIKKHGEPWYIKIDLEHYDHILLNELFINNITPPYISAELHNIQVFAMMMALGKYNAFKLVDGKSVPSLYKNHCISTNNGFLTYSFPEDSSGPFGNDINGRWMDANDFFDVLAQAKLGWKDIHCSKLDIPT